MLPTMFHLSRHVSCHYFNSLRERSYLRHPPRIFSLIRAGNCPPGGLAGHFRDEEGCLEFIREMSATPFPVFFCVLFLTDSFLSSVRYGS
ncbi:hypothetical protein CDAR_536661 [Caerostris darwini]|uniref:Uncharacterized protein n=1 Tax=Caerostris darwini TaxID=1538125 RepID=A0AAV4VHX3_9ARAC|nr:hypothetical protein CDAR_536661 [Caerostris darwini]